MAFLLLGKLDSFPTASPGRLGEKEGDESFHGPLPSVMDDFPLGVSFQASVLVLAGAQAVWSLHSVSDREGTGSQPFSWVPSTSSGFLIIIVSCSQVAHPLLKDLHSFISYIHIHSLGVCSVHRIALTPERAESCKDVLGT